jgi:hypothetical protein
LSHRRPGGFGATGRRTPCGSRGSDHEPLPVRLTPTLFIFLAPPSVGFVSYTALTGQLDAALIGQLDAAARVLYYTALFLTLLLATNAARFLEVPFYLSAWAYSFPLAAMTIATLVMFARSGVGSSAPSARRSSPRSPPSWGGSSRGPPRRCGTARSASRSEVRAPPYRGAVTRRGLHRALEATR